MVELTIEVPMEALSALRAAPRRFAAPVQGYYQGGSSGREAAQIAGMTRLEFLDELARRKLDTLRVDLEALRREVADA